MLTKIEVGKTYRSSKTKNTRTVLFLGKIHVVFTDEYNQEKCFNTNTCFHEWEEIPEEMWVNVLECLDTKVSYVAEGHIHSSKEKAFEADKFNNCTQYKLVKE